MFVGKTVHRTVFLSSSLHGPSHIGPIWHGKLLWLVALDASPRLDAQVQLKLALDRILAVRAVCPVFANRLKALPYVIFYTFSPDRDFHG